MVGLTSLSPTVISLSLPLPCRACPCGTPPPIPDATTSSTAYLYVTPGVRWSRSTGGRSNGERFYRGSERHLCSSMIKAWEDWRSDARIWAHIVTACQGRHHGHHSPLVVDEFGGQYDENFKDVDKHLLDYFTYKAVRTVLAQLQEMNPKQYAWFYNFVVDNKPQDSKKFLRALVKEKQELGERVMVTRLHLFNKWIKKYNHAKMYQAIADQNLELLRERLVQTVKWPLDGDDKKDLRVD